ncbi:MAG: 16S rRNA (cytidine(1402)-2'-O)-methyltransferase [Clostridiales bacterium]|nr:16S rRNA (cytidine(1402)-2'-O)-methyltransferase [Clostridiales bacterium]
MLYFVATPIGNLKDISYRAIEVLNMVDVIACEDTRNSLKLLNHYNIHKKLIAYHKFNEENSANGIINLLNEGKNVAIISDSGMPVISDPGETIIKKLKQNNIEYTVVPGANAGLCALILSGLNSGRFTFVGFLPDNLKECKSLLSEVKEYKTTLIFYVAPHDVIKINKQLHEVLGERKAVLVNEITKLYEKTYSFVLGEEIKLEPKGEYVLVVEGNKNLEQDELLQKTIQEHLLYYINLKIDKGEAIKRVAKERKLSKNEVYQQALKLFN